MLKQTLVNTGSVSNAIGGKVDGLRTGRQRQLVPFGNLGEALRQLVHLQGVYLADGKRLQPLPDFRVQIDKAENAFLGISSQLTAQPVKFRQMILHGKIAADYYRIIAPDYAVAANLIAYVPKGFHDFRFGRQPCFYLPVIGRQGKLKIIPVAQRINDIQPVQHWPGIFCPEHNAVNNLRVQDNLGDAPGISWIFNIDEPLVQPVNEPIGIKGRNICAPAGTYNQCSSPFIFSLYICSGWIAYYSYCNRAFRLCLSVFHLVMPEILLTYQL